MENRYAEVDASDDGDYRALTYGSYDVGDGSLMYAGRIRIRAMGRSTGRKISRSIPRW